jgi:ferredoxin
MRIDIDNCIGCGDCMDYCDVNTISLTEGVATIDNHVCGECWICYRNHVCSNSGVLSFALGRQL